MSKSKLHDIMDNPSNYTLEDLRTQFDEHRDLILVEDEGVVERYFNPDANSGFQFVTNLWTFGEIMGAYNNGNVSGEGFWDYLDSIAWTECFDISEDNIAYGAYRAFGLMLDPYGMGFVRSANRDADMHELVKLVKERLERLEEEA